MKFIFIALTHLEQCSCLNDIENGQVAITGYNYGDTATYSCDNGYELIRNEVRVCQDDGQWSREDPICLAGI